MLSALQAFQRSGRDRTLSSSPPTKGTDESTVPVLRKTHSSSSLGKSFNRSLSKNITYLRKSPVLGKLYVCVSEAILEGTDTTVKPVVVAYFERQRICSSISKDAKNPHWKDAFVLYADIWTYAVILTSYQHCFQLRKSIEIGRAIER